VPTGVGVARAGSATIWMDSIAGGEMAPDLELGGTGWTTPCGRGLEHPFPGDALGVEG
jgi:hypothetical protein